MPIDKPEATAAMNTRRTFLARAAMGGALAAAAAPLLSALPAGATAGRAAQADKDGLDDPTYLILASQVEQAAALVYVEASKVSGLSSEVTSTLGKFEAHHLAAVTELAKFMDTATAAISYEPNAEVLATKNSLGGDEKSVLTALQKLEETLAATHLSAIGSLKDQLTAKTAGQVLAVENQHAAHLGRLAGVALAELVPATVTTDGALADAETPAKKALSDATSTTTADATTTTAADAGGADSSTAETTTTQAG